MKLAEQIGCSRWEAKERVDYQELIDWIAYWDIKHEAEVAEAEKSKTPSKRGIKGRG